MQASFAHKSHSVLLLAIAAFVLAGALALAGTQAAFANDVPSSVPDSTAPTNSTSSKAELSASTKSKPKLRGLVSRSSGLYYYDKNGKKLKRSWKTVRGKRYYFNKSGVAVHGVVKIEGARYFFKSNCALYRPSRLKIAERGKYKYAVTKNGIVLTGWELVNKKLYHFSRSGKMDTNKKIDGVIIKKDGTAVSSNATKSKKLALTILNKISSMESSPSKRLKAAWNYMVSRKNFKYWSIYPNQSKKGWQYDIAYQMLKNKKGNCFGFACAFAQLAEVAGYDPQLVLGRVPGSRDGAGDGFTRHSWVKINGKHYDPEMKFAEGYNIYGLSGYIMPTRNVRYKSF